jgi:tRNA (cytidine/uridine-2'-O-)-methyltransferase
VFNIVLYQPEIPPNTGNIIRLCANSGCNLHLIEPLGFNLDDKHVRRAGLDYEMQKKPLQYASFDDFLNSFQTIALKNEATVYLCSTKASTPYSSVSFKPGDSFVFGPETRGLPSEILDRFSDNQKITIPMVPLSRSLNLANSVAIIVYEAWRQQRFTCNP